MTTVNKILIGVLAAQAALVALTWWPGDDSGHEQKALVEIDPNRLTAIAITGRVEDGEVPEPLRLEKDGEHWVLPDSARYPVDTSKVDELVEKFTDLRVRSPMATQASSYAALEVADDKYTRKIDLTAGDTTVSLVVGAGSGSTVHVRRADETEVYSATGFTAWSIGDQPNRYFDPVYVKVEKDAVDSFTIRNDLGTFTLVKTGDAWLAEEGPAGHSISKSDREALMNTLLTVRMTEPVGTEAQPAYGLDEGVRVEWTQTVDEATTAGGYTVGALDDGVRYVKADDQPYIVKVNEASLLNAMDAALDDRLLVLDIDG